MQTAPAAPRPVKHSPDGNPILEDGTPIRLRLTRTLSSAECKTGDRVDFEVVDPVVLDGITVVPQGSIAWGTISDAEHKKRMARGGKLAVEISAVKLANFEKARLRAAREATGGGHTAVMSGAMVGTALVFLPAAPLFLLMHGKDVKIPEGTEFTAYVDGDMVFVPLHKTAPTTEPPPQPVPAQPAQEQPTTDTAAAELTLTSTPDGADIEMDGAFVGSTPSTITIGSGDHTVRLRKNGFQPYEKHLRVTGGTISLHADLEPAP